MLESNPSDRNVVGSEREQLLPRTADNGPPGEHGQSSAIMPESISLRVAATSFSFLVMGIHASAIGVLLPDLESYYHIGDTMVSLLFLTPLLGYLIASMLNGTIHTQFGRRGLGFISSLCQLLVTTVLSLHPPFEVYLFVFLVAGLGSGLIDTGWCAWAGALPNANTVSGFLHGSYSAGAMIGPYLTTSLVTGAGLPWYSFYQFMNIISIMQLIFLTWAFWNDTATKYCSERHHQTLSTPPTDANQSLITTTTTTSTTLILKSKPKPIYKYSALWICGTYLLMYEGAENIISGWVFTFMKRTRHATPYAASLTASGFWAGMALGRMVLGPVTDRLGERATLPAYLTCGLLAHLTFSIFPRNSDSIIAFSIVAVTLFGFALGPTFPTGIVMLTRLLPPESHVDAVAAVVFVGQVSGDFFPFVVGAMAERWGVGKVLQWGVGILVLATLIAWCCFPGMSLLGRSTKKGLDGRDITKPRRVEDGEDDEEEVTARVERYIDR